METEQKLRVVGTVADVSPAWRKDAHAALAVREMTVLDLSRLIVSRSGGVKCESCGQVVAPNARKDGRIVTAPHSLLGGKRCRGSDRAPVRGLPRQYISRLLGPTAPTVPSGTYLEICEILDLDPNKYTTITPEVLRLGQETTGCSTT
jgi:hypothetical protein